jgi:hypothetical protein
VTATRGWAALLACFVLGVAACALTDDAAAHLPAGVPHGSAVQKSKAATRNLAHARGACRAYRRVLMGHHPRSHCRAVPWLERVRAELAARANPSWAWYRSSATQCVVAHEGGWTSVNPVGYYGRFQMDVSFQNETAYGRRAFRRWGTANRWPPAVQVFHAWSIWKVAGWSRWPTYYRYCR